jgi:hypothetical protein
MDNLEHLIEAGKNQRLSARIKSAMTKYWFEFIILSLLGLGLWKLCDLLAILQDHIVFYFK